MSAAREEQFDPSDVGFVQDPYPVYRWLRENDPVHWAQRSYWVATRYADIVNALRDERFSNSPAPFALVHARHRDRFIAAAVANRLMAFKDGLDHLRLRGQTVRLLAARVKDMEFELSELAGSVLDTLPRGERVDFLSSFAEPYAAQAICRLLGFPEEDVDQITKWSYGFFRMFHAIPSRKTFDELNIIVGEFRDYASRVFERKLRNPSEDLVSKIAAQIGDQFSYDEAIDNTLLLAADGVGNVQSGLANCLSVLLDLPELPRSDLASTAGTNRVIDECLRLESPGSHMGRIAREEVEIGGKTIRANSIVLLSFAAGNRDPAAFEDPNEFRTNRTGPPTLSFGAGPHMCPGNSLVRNEIRAALMQLFAKGKSVTALDSRKEWLAMPGHRWLGSYHVRLED